MAPRDKINLRLENSKDEYQGLPTTDRARGVCMHLHCSSPCPKEHSCTYSRITVLYKHYTKRQTTDCIALGPGPWELYNTKCFQ